MVAAPAGAEPVPRQPAPFPPVTLTVYAMRVCPDGPADAGATKWTVNTVVAPPLPGATVTGALGTAEAVDVDADVVEGPPAAPVELVPRVPQAAIPSVAVKARAMRSTRHMAGV